ncbi:MAG: restriction endonuclease subunit S, partial [Bacteroidia bacterium]|nr:restriction endonuclease subunit S [Bacteroidia bacterium]
KESNPQEKCSSERCIAPDGRIFRNVQKTGGQSGVKCRLGDICIKIGSGATPRGGKEAYKEKGIAIIRSQNVLDYTFSADGLAYIDDGQAAQLDTVTVQKNDVLINITGDSVARACIAPNELLPARVNQHVAIVRADCKKANSHYLLYFLQFKKEHLLSIASSGGTRNALTKKMLEDIEINLPPLPKQRTIAATLSSLDDKIENNRKINQHLEQMAQAIFKSWFVDFEPWGGVMPNDWREGNLSEITTVIMGQSPDGASYNEEGIGTVFYQGRAEFGFRFPTRRLFTTRPKRLAPKGAVLMSVRAPVGDINVAYESCSLGRGLAGIQSNSGFQSFILYSMFSLKRQLDVFNGQGTVFGSINKNDMANLPVLIPSDEVLCQFEKLVNPMDAAIEKNYVESCNLQETRDALLPRLMSGELSVGDAVEAS